MIAAGFVCFVGCIDDRFDLPSRVKLALQIVSVLPIVLLGYYVDRVVAFGYPIELGWLGIPLTVLWLVGCINALNLIDGMDGLASIVGLSTAAMLGVIAASEGHAHVAAMAIVLAASLAGFLVYNLPPASIFLGDSGSMVIGLTVGVLGMQGSLKTSATLGDHRPRRGDDPADVRHRRGHRAAKTDRPAVRHARSAAHPPSTARSRLEPLASAVPARRVVPDDRRRGHGRHDFPPRRLGLDHRHDPGGADDPPAAVRPRRVRFGQGGRRPGDGDLCMQLWHFVRRLGGHAPGIRRPGCEILAAAKCDSRIAIAGVATFGTFCCDGSKRGASARWRSAGFKGRSIADVLGHDGARRRVNSQGGASNPRHRRCWPKWAWATCGWGSRRRRLAAAKRSGSNSSKRTVPQSHRADLLLLDEPTTGLHFADIRKLLDVLHRWSSGNTVIVIEHNLDVIKTADWILDLGPGGGADGGEIVVEGTPEDLVANKRSLTGRHLKPMLERAPKPVLVDTPQPKKRSRKAAADKSDLLAAN